MKQTFLDECFKARMDYLRERFPLEDFRKKFKEEYTRRGMVMMQDKPVNMLNSCGMVLDSEHGFIFSSQHNIDIALWLVRRWGFSVTKRCEHEGRKEFSAYIVQLPDEYLRRMVVSDKAGMVKTGLRSISNVDRTKIERKKDLYI